MKKVACFLTCGYTESGAMQSFLESINSDVKFIQNLPNKTIKRKGMPKRLSNTCNGLTGDKLIDAVVSRVSNDNFNPDEFCAIIVEDDTDARFRGCSEDEIRRYHDNATARIRAAAGTDISVIFLLASPEIEAWFITDWHNCFEIAYKDMMKDVSGRCMEFFLNRLHLCINNELAEYKESIEDFPNKPGDYHKLSDILIDLLADKSSWCDEQDVLDSRELYYSKQKHGVAMLQKLNGDIVASKCRKFFAPAYLQIKSID